MCIYFCKASCSTDGQLRIYEAPDVMNLSQWTLNVCMCTRILYKLYTLVHVHVHVHVYMLFSVPVCLHVYMCSIVECTCIYSNSNYMYMYMYMCILYGGVCVSTQHVLSCKPGTSCLSWNPSRQVCKLVLLDECKHWWRAE